MQPPPKEQKKQKIEKQQNDHKNNELNQFGRPKQKVIFYELTQQMKRQAKQKLQQDKMVEQQTAYEKAKNDGQKVWDKFYKFHKCSFFKDRTYLQREIQPITLFKTMYAEHKKPFQFVELGCGVGNTLFPLLREYPCFNYLGFDISAKAIALIQQQMQKHPQFQQRMKVSVANLVTDQIPYKGHGDLSTLIFVLSAIVPQKHMQVIQKIYQWMKPGSFFYFRDYGRYDFGQLNLSSKGNRKLRDNFYMKNDGVCVYYFDLEEIQKMFEKVGLVKVKSNSLCKLLQNRKRDLKMYRVWLQCLYYKPPIQSQLLLQLKQIIVKQSENQKKQQQNDEDFQTKIQESEKEENIKKEENEHKNEEKENQQQKNLNQQQNNKKQ